MYVCGIVMSVSSWWEEISWLVNDGYASVAPPLGEPSLGNLPGLTEGIQELDGGEVHDAIISSHHVEEVVHHTSRCVPARSGHVRQCLPFLCRRVESGWGVVVGVVVVVQWWRVGVG